MKPIEMYAKSVRNVLLATGKSPDSVRVITTELARFMGKPTLHDHVVVSDRGVRLFPSCVEVEGHMIGLAGVPDHRIVAHGGDVAFCIT